jgi:hypothetical protein
MCVYVHVSLGAYSIAICMVYTVRPVVMFFSGAWSQYSAQHPKSTIIFRANYIVVGQQCKLKQSGTRLMCICQDKRLLTCIVLDHYATVHQPIWYFPLLVSLLYKHCYEIVHSEPLLSLVSGPGCTTWTANILEDQKCVFRYVVVNIQYVDNSSRKL